MLAGAWSLTASELKCSPARVGREERRTVKPTWRSHGVDRRRDGRATMENRRRQRSSEVVMLELREEGRRMGMGAARASDFYMGQREAEAPGHLQCPAMKAPVTRSEVGGGEDYDRIKACG
jgi:hypothetical protein